MVLGTFIKEVYLNGHTSFLKIFISRMLYFIRLQGFIPRKTKDSGVIAIWSNVLICNLNDWKIHCSSIKKNKCKSSSFTTRISVASSATQWRHLRGSEHAPYHFYSCFTREKNLERGERGISYVSPCIFPILLKQVNGKRALPRLPFVFHEMSSSRIESLYRDTFARCVIRSLLLLVKESPPLPSHFHVVSEGIFLWERSIADHFTHRMCVGEWHSRSWISRDSIKLPSSPQNSR